MGAICAPAADDTVRPAGDPGGAICAPAGDDTVRPAGDPGGAICAPAGDDTVRPARICSARNSSGEAEETCVEAVVGLGNCGHCAVGGAEPVGQRLCQHRCGQRTSDRGESEFLRFRSECLGSRGQFFHR